MASQAVGGNLFAVRAVASAAIVETFKFGVCLREIAWRKLRESGLIGRQCSHNENKNEKQKSASGRHCLSALHFVFQHLGETCKSGPECDANVDTHNQVHNDSKRLVNYVPVVKYLACAVEHFDSSG